jgi:hypothetical protein
MSQLRSELAHFPEKCHRFSAENTDQLKTLDSLFVAFSFAKPVPEAKCSNRLPAGSPRQMPDRPMQ